MWWRLLVGLLVGGTYAFTSAPILLDAASGNYAVSPGGACPMMLPAKLSVLDASGAQALDDIPFFTAKSDNTLSWESRQGHLCIEATGENSGAAVGVNLCNGGASQLWNLMPRGLGKGIHIRLKDTAFCLDANVYASQKGGLSGAPIELRECGEKMTDSWKFEPSFLPRTEQTFSLRNVILCVTSLAAVAALGLRALIWRQQPKTPNMATNPSGILLDVERGVALTVSNENQPTSKNGNISMNVATTSALLKPSLPRASLRALVAMRAEPGTAHCPNVTRAEASFFEKLSRRLRVYWLAAQIFWGYQMAGRKDAKVKRKLGIPKNDDNDHPSIQLLWNNVHEENSAKLMKGIRQLEGFWVKVGQYLSSRADVMPPEYLTALASLQDSMPPKSFADINSTLNEELSEDELRLFESIDEVPLSTASLAQVHRATLKDGRHVVVKAQHRGVASLMVQDMENLKSILKIVARFNPDWDFGPVTSEYNKEVRKELDFRAEASNMDQVRRLLHECDVQAIVPKVVLAKEKVLVMDFCEGFVVRDTASLDKFKVDRKLLLRRVCEAWAAQMHVGGVFNADPHPGNILVSTVTREDGDCSVPILLDFGLTKRLDSDLKIAFARLMHAADETDVDALLQSFDEMGLRMNRYDPFEDMASMQRSFGNTIPQSQREAAAKDRSDQYKRRMEAMREDQGVTKGQKLRNPVDAWPAELVFFSRVTGMLRGLCSRLEVAYPYLNTMAVAARKALREATPVEVRATQLIDASAEAIDTVLQRRLMGAVQQLQAEGHIVGLQISVMYKGQQVANIAAGVLGTANPRPVTPSTLFNIFSVSKAFLVIAMLRLLQEERLHLDDPVAKYWPEFGTNGKEKITIRHILTHQAGLANALPENASLDTLCDFEGMTRFIETASPEHEPGSKTQYHYLTFAWLCGGIIERIVGQPYHYYLDRIIKNSVSSKLGLFLGGLPEDLCNDDLATLSMEKPRKDDRADTAREKNRNARPASETGKTILAKYRGREQLLNPSIFNMRKVRQARIPSANGHASATALVAVFDSLLNPTHGALLARDILEQAQKPQPVPAAKSEHEPLLMDGTTFGLGFQSHEFTLSGGRTVRSIGHAGLGGSIVLAIPEADLCVAFVTNRLSQNSPARQNLLNTVWDEFGLQAPASLRL